MNLYSEEEEEEEEEDEQQHFQQAIIDKSALMNSNFARMDDF